MKLVYTLLLILAVNTAFCQANTCELSDAVDLPQKGWNKLVIMRNGNTILLHLELHKPLIIKIFSKEHKEIASQKYSPDVLNVNTLDLAVFKGLYDINNEAVLFMQQPVDNKEGLVRMRFNPDNGKIIEEKLMLQSASFSNKTTYEVLKQNGTDTYAVCCFRNTIWHPDTRQEVIRYNARHEAVDTVPITIDVTNFKRMDLVGADIDAYGNIFITIYLDNVEVSSAALRTAYNNNPVIRNKYLAFIYIPKDGNKFIGTSVKLNNDIDPSYTNFSYNPFAKNLNLLLLQSQSQLVKNGINTVAVNKRTALFFVIDGNDMSLHYKWLTNNKINDLLYHNDTSRKFPGVPIKMFTANNGLTTIVSEEYIRNQYAEHGYMVPMTEMGTIAVTRLNDTGEELGAVVIPKAQFVRDNLLPYNLSHRDVNKRLFIKQGYRDLQQNDFVNQFASINTYESGKDLFIVYNDDKRNFATTGTTVNSVYDFTYTDGIYCLVNRKNEVKKHFLFGEPAANESKSGAVESACFDDKSNTYATLMQYRKGEDITIHIAWCHLD